MADLATLNEIDALSVLLSRCGIKTLADLKRCIGSDADDGIGWVAINSGASESLLFAVLIAEIGEDPGKKDTRNLLRYWRALKTFPAVLSQVASDARLPGKQKGARRARVWRVFRQLLVRCRRRLPRLRRNWPDVIVFAVLPMILIGLGLRAHSISKRIVPYVSVKAAASLPIFHRVNDEIEIATTPGPKDALTSLDEARNRYTLMPVAAGAPLTNDLLLSLDLSNKMQNRQILFLPLKPGSYDSNLPIPCEAILILSPRQPDPQVAEPDSFEVIVLRLQEKGDSRVASVAVPTNKFERAARLLASRDIFLAQAMR